MMAKPMLDSVLTWAREYKIEGFLFDLMGHHVDRRCQKIVTLFNARNEPVHHPVAAVAGVPWRLHPVQVDSADPLVSSAYFDPATGVFEVPARTTTVFGAHRTPEDQGDLLLDHVG